MWSLKRTVELVDCKPSWPAGLQSIAGFVSWWEKQDQGQRQTGLGWARKRKRFLVVQVCAGMVRRHSEFKRSICTTNILLEAIDVLKFFVGASFDSLSFQIHLLANTRIHIPLDLVQQIQCFEFLIISNLSDQSSSLDLGILACLLLCVCMRVYFNDK